jgi:hypothetical protein
MKKLIMTASLLWAIGPFTTRASASTYIGNGGSSGDIELTVSMKQIADVFYEVSKEGAGADVCGCSEQFQNHSACDTLTSLTPTQEHLCSDTMKSKALELSDLAYHRERIRIEWTHEQIEVMDNGYRRAADAAADPDQNLITINQERFLEMPAFDRIFLLTHELMHFTLVDGKPLTDEGPLGPFDGPDGSRRYINAVAAAGAMRAEDYGFLRKYRASLDRAQGWKQAWIDLDGEDEKWDGGKSSSFSLPDYHGSTFAFRYYPFKKFGFALAYTSVGQDTQILSSTSASETVRIWSAGPSYRIFPFKDPVSYWGQTQIVLNAFLEYVQSSYSLNDTYVGVDEKTSAWGAGATGAYYIPVWKFWLSLGGGIHFRHYQYSDVNVNYDKPLVSTQIGVSYGF